MYVLSQRDASTWIEASSLVTTEGRVFGDSYFYALGDARGMMSTATKVYRDLIQMEVIQVGFCGVRGFAYDSFLSFLFLLNEHH